jgi:hypothetical protein
MAQLNIANPHASGNVLRPLSRFYASDANPDLRPQTYAQFRIRKPAYNDMGSICF